MMAETSFNNATLNPSAFQSEFAAFQTCKPSVCSFNNLAIALNSSSRDPAGDPSSSAIGTHLAFVDMQFCWPLARSTRQAIGFAQALTVRLALPSPTAYGRSRA